jgi:hypothetical protein
MRKLHLICIILIGLVIGLSAQPKEEIGKLKRVKLREGISAKLPNNFYKMSNEDIVERYRSYKLPIAMFSSQDRLMEFGLSISDNFWGGNDLELLMEFQKSNLAALFDDIEFKDSGIKKVHKYDMAFFEINTASKFSRSFEKKFTLLHYAVVDNRVLVFNFSCPAERKDELRSVAWQIMESLKIAKSVF